MKEENKELNYRNRPMRYTIILARKQMEKQQQKQPTNGEEKWEKSDRKKSVFKNKFVTH